VRTHRKAGHMDASDLIKTLPNTLRGGGRPHMGLGRFDRLAERLVVELRQRSLHASAGWCQGRSRPRSAPDGMVPVASQVDPKGPLV
jgi:hypothetical protein